MGGLYYFVSQSPDFYTVLIMFRESHIDCKDSQTTISVVEKNVFLFQMNIYCFEIINKTKQKKCLKDPVQRLL